MPQFIHLADAKDIASIRRSGIKAVSTGWKRKGIFCVPVLRNYVLTHQWLRELKRRGMKTLVAVQFLVPSGEGVLVGRYNEDPLETPASGAVKIFNEHVTGLGLQVFLTRKVLPSGIRRIYTPPQIAGWRYHPDAHGKPPFCGCKFCVRGEIKNRKLREAYGDD